MATRQIAPVRVARRIGDGKPFFGEAPAVWAHDGLAVTKDVDEPNRWVVTHVASGYFAIAGFHTQHDAVTAAESLLPLGDWTVSRSRIPKSMKSGTLAIRAELRKRGVIP